MSRLLIVDDDPMNLRALSRGFKARGVEVRTATNSLEAVEIIGQWFPSHMLCDVDLGRDNGIDLARMVRDSMLPFPIRILLMSGLVSDERALQAREAGAVGLLEKPFETTTAVILLGL